MRTMTNMMSIATLLAVSSVGFAFAADLPKEGSYDYKACFTRSTARIDFSDTHSAYSYNETATAVSISPGGLFDGESVRCVGSVDLSNGKRMNLCDIELVAPCRAYVARLKQAGADATLTEYAGAQHGFDWFMFKEPRKLPAARTGVNCSLAEGERGQLVDTANGKAYDPAVSCNVKGGTLLYNEAAAAATTATVKEFLTTTFGLNK